MGTRHAQGLLVLFLLGASWTLAQNLSCHKGTSLNIDDSPSTAFNWTTEKVETCDNGSLCQESALMIKAGERSSQYVSNPPLPNLCGFGVLFECTFSSLSQWYNSMLSRKT
uniref:Testis expressed 101 n=1 Tax=Molossus molossus TaxID=27622 RepID=A0A7J8CBJ4_MOLMO|nr:testis expressed 101 [Molossus molossus]